MHEQDFIRLCRELGVLRFGEFTLKSGRRSPYFFNAGLFNTGRAIGSLGRYYARAAIESGVAFDMLFGPAYKGIPLVTATAAAMAEHERRDLPFAFNRKEAKDHGEGGTIVGAPLKGRVLIVDDVITAGTQGADDHATAEERSVLADRIKEWHTELVRIANLNYNGPATVAITTSDLGNTGIGGALTDSDTVNLTINAVNWAAIVAQRKTARGLP